MFKIEKTDLSPDEFRMISHPIILKLFDVTKDEIWSKLPPEYRTRDDFMKIKKSTEKCDASKYGSNTTQIMKMLNRPNLSQRNGLLINCIITADELASIPHFLVLKIFDIAFFQNWQKLPVEYTKRLEFYKQSFCCCNSETGRNLQAARKLTCWVCMQNYDRYTKTFDE